MDEGRKMVLLFPTLLRFRNEEDKSRFAPEYDTLAFWGYIWRANKMTLESTFFIRREWLTFPTENQNGRAWMRKVSCWTNHEASKSRLVA
jgi:hypothetical protein